MNIEAIVETVKGQTSDRVEAGTRQLKELKSRALDFVVEHPALALAGTFLLGYTIARVARRA